MKRKNLLVISPLIIYIINKTSYKLKDNKTRNINKSNIAEKSLLKINSSDKKINGYYNIVLNNTSIMIHNDNLVYKNINKNIWIFYTINKYWVISSFKPNKSQDDNLLYKSLESESLLPIECFNDLNISIENKKIYNIIKKLEKETFEQNINQDFLEFYSNDIENDNIEYILESYIPFKSSDILPCNIKRSILIKGAENNEINGEYKIFPFKNRYGYIFKKGDFWIAKCVLIDKKYLNFNIIWYLSKESPLEGIYFKNKFIYCSNLKDPGNFLKFPSYELLSLTNSKSKIIIKLIA